jgi:hypothetical protein
MILSSVEGSGEDEVMGESCSIRGARGDRIILLPSPVQKKRSILSPPPSCRGERGGLERGWG